MIKKMFLGISEVLGLVAIIGGFGAGLGLIFHWFYELYYGTYLIAFLQFVALFCVSWGLEKYVEWKES